MTSVALEILIIFLLIVLNGILAMSEIAIVSARKARLQQAAEEGNTRARTALELARSPGRFLSTVQIGITLIGIFAGAFGGATIAEQLAAWLGRIPLAAPYSEAISVGVVVVGITYLSLVIGELAPKRLALGDAERVASIIAPPMQALSRIASPVVYLLNLSTEGVLRLFGVRPSSDPAVTEEEIKILIEQGARAGVFEPIEEQMVEHVFRLGDQKVNALITPRTDIIWLDVGDPPERILHKVTASGHSRYPVAQVSLDEALGWVLTKDLLAQSLTGRPIDLQAVLKPALYIPAGIPALVVLEWFKKTRSKAALVVDEYGGLQGMVTVYDILESIVGDLPEPDEAPEAVQRKDGSWLLDGRLPIDEFLELFQVKEPPDAGKGHYQTLGGFVMAFLGRIPSTGDTFEWGGLRLEVVDMDGRRVDKILAASVDSSLAEGVRDRSANPN